MPQAAENNSSPRQVKTAFRNKGELASNRPEDRSTAALSDGSFGNRQEGSLDFTSPLTELTAMLHHFS